MQQNNSLSIRLRLPFGYLFVENISVQIIDSTHFLQLICWFRFRGLLYYMFWWVSVVSYLPTYCNYRTKCMIQFVTYMFIYIYIYLYVYDFYSHSYFILTGLDIKLIYVIFKSIIRRVLRLSLVIAIILYLDLCFDIRQ